MNDKWRVYFRKLGDYLGYPECCVEYFIETYERHPLIGNHPLIGTGFMPCLCCGDKSAEEMTMTINRNRKWGEKFPYNGEIPDSVLVELGIAL